MGSIILEKTYKAAMSGDWKNITHHYKDRPLDLSFPVTLDEDTALHIAVYSKQAQPLQDLLEVVDDMENFIVYMEPPAPENDQSPSTEQMKFLRRKNKFGNTALHEATICGNYEAVRLLVARCPALLLIQNNSGETPLFTAAGFGEAGIVEFLFRSEPEQRGNDKRRLFNIHSQRGDGLSILSAAIIGQHFETALLLLEVDGSLHSVEDRKGRTALQYLADMPSAFKSGYSMGIFETLLYCCLPVIRHRKVKLQTGDQAEQGVIRDLERGSGSSLERNQRGGLLNYLKAPKGFWPARLERFWNQKIKHVFALRLAKLLIMKDDQSWKSVSKTEERQTREERIPLFLATRNGIEEIVRVTIKLHPHAVGKLNDKGQSILDVAVMHRQKKIFDLVKQRKIPWARLHRVIDMEGNTMLHHVADMKYYSGGTMPGPALQLQEELQWFEQVREVIPSHYVMLQNNEGKTAEDLFKESHKEQLENARTWIKETTQSCSAVAAFVATVVFAAVYTAPGGSDDNGKPNFIDSPYFMVFTVSDVFSLASSLTSLVVFLSLLTSRFELKEFRNSLPRKLLVGFTFLFFAVTTAVLSFGATIFILIQSKRKSTTLFLSIAALLPVLVFAIMQIPLIILKKTGKARALFLFPGLPRGEKLIRRVD
ncbi:hypothetical protein OIU78_024492 [Salix suchowensis]|nr:hypothetical protein OIU78_024492 [Salix suchowensis]